MKAMDMKTNYAVVKPGSAVVLVNNTSSDDVAALYPTLLRAGISVITLNTKVYSAELPLYESILTASHKSGARFFHEATVGVGLPIISTLKDLIATGDEVTRSAAASPARCLADGLLHADHRDRGCVLGHNELHLQRVLDHECWRAQLLLCWSCRARTWVQGCVVLTH